MTINDISGLKLIEDLWQGTSLQFVAAQSSDARRFLLERPVRAESLSSEEAQHLRRLYHFRPDADLPAAIIPGQIFETDSGPVLLYEFPAGRLLATITGKPLPAAKALAVSLSIARALAEIHAAGYVHAGISPARIWYDEAGARVALSGLCSSAGHGRVHAAPSGHIEPESWPYIAPERVGRNLHTEDSRCDLYSLSAIMYELFSGVPPFQPRTMLECFHAHLALPLPELICDTSIFPQQVARVVRKLLCKNPDERYQSAAGLVDDLRRIYDDLLSNGEITEFEPGKHDSSTRLHFSDDLFDRAAEFRQAHDWVCRRQGATTAPVLVLTGAPGSGKTDFFRRAILPDILETGRLAGCKFDQALFEQPAGGLVQVAETICRNFAGDSSQALELWQKNLKTLAGNDLGLIAARVPALARIIGNLAIDEVIDPAEARKRTCRAWKIFLRACSYVEKPLYIFFDDIQWVDDLSSELLIELLQEKNPSITGPYLILAYRDEEFASEHPLRKVVDELKAGSEKLLELEMKPLSRQGVENLLAATFGGQLNESAALADFLYRRTAGNPLFLRHFLQKMHAEGHLSYADECWIWHSSALENLGCTDNVVDLLCDRLAAMTPASRRVMEVAVCLGYEFATTTVGKTMNCSLSEVADALQSLNRDGFILSTGPGRFRFSHDRIQQAAGLLLPPQNAMETWLAVARVLVRDFAAAEVSLFTAASHLLRPNLAPVDAEERLNWIKLLHQAAQMSRKSAAPLATLAYSNGALRFIEPLADEMRDTTRELMLLAGEACYLAGRLQEAVGRLSELFESGRTFLEKAPACRLLCNVMVTQGDMTGALDMGFAALAETSAGISPDSIAADMSHWLQIVDAARSGIELTTLKDLPDMHDQELQAQMDIIATMILPAQFYRQDLMHGLVARMVEITLRHGIARESAYAFIWWGMMLVDRRYARYEEGFAFGRAGYDLVVERRISGLYTKACLFFGDIVNFYREPLRSDRAYLDEAFKKGIENGDLIHACYACNHILTNMIIAADPLHEVWQESERLISFVREAGDANIEAILTSQRRFVLAMQGKTVPPGIFSGPDFDEAAFERRIAGSQMILMIFWYYVWKMVALYLHGRYDEAAEALKIADSLESSDRWNMEVTVYVFFRGLILAAQAEKCLSGAERELMLAGIADSLKHLHDWAEACPANFMVRHALVSAEEARVRGSFLEAGRLYDQAVQEARRLQYSHLEAMACSRMASMLRSERMVFAAEAYETRAHQAFRNWGALGFAGNIPVSADLAFSSVLADQPGIARLPENRGDEHLALLQLAAMTAGASRLIIFRAEAKDVTPVAAWSSADAGVAAAGQTAAYPVAVLNYVMRTGERLIEGDCPPATAVNDPYWRQSGVRSMACLPLIVGTGSRGAVYFENRLARDAFSLEKLAVAEILSRQIFALKENERLLAESLADKDRLALAIQGANLGMWEWIIPEDRATANDRCFQMLGYSPGEVTPSRGWLLSCIHPDDMHGVNQAIDGHLAGRSPVCELNYRIRAKNSEWLHILSLGRIVEHAADGRPVRMCGFNIDFSEHHRLTERLRQSEKMEAIGQLAGGVAHDFNNLLQVITSCLDLMTMDKKIAKDLPLIEDMKRAMKRGAELARRLLMFSRRKPEQFSVLELGSLVRNTAGLLRRLIGENIVMTQEICDLSIAVKGDAGQLELLLVNLCVNARDAMPDGGRLTIGVSFCKADEAFKRANKWACDDAYGCITVKDDGCGIEKEHLNRLFEPFFTTKAPGAGTGLGLATVFGIVQQHFGGILVDSEPGHGSTFSVYLPVCRETVERAAEEAKPEKFRYRGMRVLLAEDEEIVSSMVETVLDSVGLKVTTVTDGQQALNLFAQNPAAFDLIISDAVMPYLDGFQFFKAARDIRQNIPFLFISGYTEGLKSNLKAEGKGLRILPKPFSLDILLAKITELLSENPD